MRESSVRNSPLPPSVEKAYHKKCIELKGRLNEIEDANDAARLRKRRIDRSIMKMRLERAFLLERLAKIQYSNADESDKSSSPPPAIQERPSRQRRSRRSPPVYDNHPDFPSPSAHASNVSVHGARLLYPGQSYGQQQQQQQQQQHRQSHASDYPSNYPPHPSQTLSAPRAIDRRAPSEFDKDEPMPLIHSLPYGTHVLILDGQAKQAPWTMRDVEPRLHLIKGLDNWPHDAQLQHIRETFYCPFDVHGNPVLLGWDEQDRNLKHIFKDDPQWRDPITPEGIRGDDPKQIAKAIPPEVNHIVSVISPDIASLSASLTSQSLQPIPHNQPSNHNAGFGGNPSGSPRQMYSREGESSDVGPGGAGGAGAGGSEGAGGFKAANR
ncbi:MAG: hypothetical protein M1831_003898 [Alyxoria varia]|nr:MAG: hypothetical protein M1831_003898 [Alyxoria varia]